MPGVTRLKAAGVTLFGKTNVPLNLADFQSYNDIYGTTNNLGSESHAGLLRSAASMAAGLAGVENGSIGGSIRNPAHYCGVFGHKPTWGLLPPRAMRRRGLWLSPTSQSLGPLPSAGDLEALLLAQVAQKRSTRPGTNLPSSPRPSETRRSSRGGHGQQRRLARFPGNAAPGGSGPGRDQSRQGQVDYDARPNFNLKDGHEVYRLCCGP